MKLKIIISKEFRLTENKIVYSTDPTVLIEHDSSTKKQSASVKNQVLKIHRDRKNRKGKTVTIVAGYKGPQDNLIQLSKTLKVKCGVGGTVKNNEILLQGDCREKVKQILTNQGFTVKLAGG